MARRGAKVGIALVVIALALGGVLVVADRVAASVAEDRIAIQTKTELDARKIATAKEPEVDIAGFPFLTQVLAGEYQNISITIDRPDLNGVRLTELRVDAATVRADTRAVLNGTGDVVADRITGKATIVWSDVRPLLELAGVPPVIDPSLVQLTVLNNKAEVRIPLAVEGVKFNLIAKGSVVVESGKLRLKLDGVTTDLPQTPAAVQNIIRRYQQQLAVTIRIPALPFNLVINKVETNDAGLFIIASADKVSLAAGTA